MSKKIANIQVIDPGSKPDVDTDFHTYKRADVYNYLADKYGHDAVTNIITFGTYGAKKAFKDMCTIYEKNFQASNKISSLIPEPFDGVSMTLTDIFNPDHERYEEAVDFRNRVADDEWKEVLEGAIALEGRVRETGVHACGVLMAGQSLDGILPSQVRQDDERVISQWTYQDCEAIGLIKMDLLGLDTIDLIEKTLEYIERSGKEAPDMQEIIDGEMNDPKTIKLLKEARTVGVFQLGESGVRDLLRKIKPDSLEEIVATTALYRPGPMGMNSHLKFANRKNGHEEIEPIHPEFQGTVMDDIMKNTYGLCVPAGSLVFDSEQSKFVPIETLSAGVSRTPSLNLKTGNLESKAISKLFSTGKKNILKIHTNGNRSTRVSEDHEVLTQRGWVKASDLSRGDKIAANTSAFETTNSTSPDLSPDRSYLLGAILGDGCVNGTLSPFIINSDESLKSEIENIVAKEFPNGKTHRISRFRDGNEYTQYVYLQDKRNGMGVYERSNPDAEKTHEILDWMKRIGYDNKLSMYTKDISETVEQGTNESLSNVIAGLWDTDGTVGENAIQFTTTSISLFQSVCRSLVRLGVDFGVSETPYKNESRKNRTAYRIYPSLKDFKDKIQPYLRSKKRKSFNIELSKESKHGEIHGQALDGLIPRIAEDIKRKDKSANVWSKATLTRYAKEIDPEAIYNGSRKLGLFFEEKGLLSDETSTLVNTRWKRVIEVEDDGVDDCYDIEVEDNHNFLLDGFIVHNCIYQEQILQISNRIGGMTLQEGDSLRKAMGKKNIEAMNKMKPKFFEGGKENGFSEKALNALWETMEPFAKYAFNRSHSASYAIMAYQTAYLKANHPTEFMSAAIAGAMENNNKKEKKLELMRETHRMKLKLGPVDANQSDIEVAPALSSKQFDIVLGFAGIKSVSRKLSHTIVSERDANGPYKSPEDFIKRNMKHDIKTKSVYESLALAGVFDSFGYTRASVVESIPHILTQEKKTQSKGDSLFAAAGIEVESSASMSTDVDTEYNFSDKLKMEANMCGMYVSAHPLDNTGVGLKHAGRVKISDLINEERSSWIPSHKNSTIRIVGAVTEVASKTSKNGAKRYNLTVDDGTGYIEVMATGNIAESFIKQDIINAAESKRKSEGTLNLPLDMFVKDDKQKDMLLSESIVPISEPERNDVYILECTANRRGGEGVSARLVDIKPLKMDKAGKLPARVKLTSEWIKNKKELQSTLKQAATEYPGNFELWIGDVSAMDTHQLTSGEELDIRYKDTKLRVDISSAFIRKMQDTFTVDLFDLGVTPNNNI